jgi:hypothetical protein
MSFPIGSRTRIALIGSGFYFFFLSIFKYLATISVLFCIGQWVYRVSSWNGGATMGQHLFLSTMPLIIVRMSTKVIEATMSTISQRIERWMPNTELAGIVSIAFVGVLMMQSAHWNRGIVPIQVKIRINLGSGAIHRKRSTTRFQKRSSRFSRYGSRCRNV